METEIRKQETLKKVREKSKGDRGREKQERDEEVDRAALVL